MRPSATIVIPAWNEWELTRSCLETLRPTLALRDQVVVVDNGSVDGTSEGLRRFPWVRVVRHAENTGFAAGCNSGAAGATGDVVVFLNNDTLLPSRWLDGLLRPFEDSSVGATGPRSNFVSGPQLVPDVPYSADRTAEMQRFARTWRQEHRGQTSPTERLVGFCLAVRREAFEAVGGFSEGFGLGEAEDDDLCLRLVDAGHRLLITHESFVHRYGHRAVDASGVERLAAKRDGRRRPADPATALLSASMIVKDEEENLPDCLAALKGLVDEIVVYDTGSTDATVEIARRAGATVIEGFWDDDFSRARNAALARCTGTWILAVDADELVQGDPTVVREELRRAAGANALAVQIANLGDEGAIALWHTGHRLFRRGQAHWSGRLHEQVVPLAGHSLAVRASSLTLEHSGYTTRALVTRDKRERNLRVAQGALAADGGGDALALISVGRSLSGIGRSVEAVEHLQRALDMTERVDVRRHVLRTGTELLLDLGRPDEALEWLARLRPISTSDALLDYLEGVAQLNLRNPEAAMACFDRIDPDRRIDDGMVAIPDNFLGLRRGLALLQSERWSEAVAELLTAARMQGHSHAFWVPLLHGHVRGHLPLDDLVALDPHPRSLNLLAHALNADPKAAQALAVHMWDAGRDRLAVVAFLDHLAAGLDLDAIVDWTVRLRREGYDEQCLLVSRAADGSRPVLERLQITAMIATAFADARADALLIGLLPDLADPQIKQALLVLDHMAPAYLPPFVKALVRDRDRLAATVTALTELGAQEQAAALLEHCAA